MIIVVAPAKLNLTLEVLAKRPDGYHEIKSIAQTVSLCDTLQFSPADNLEYACNLPGWSAERSLVSRAAETLLTAYNPSRGARIDINKRIPLSSGLGGDSSDAVAVLRGLNMLWKLGISPPELLTLAAQLGSDLPLFIQGGTVLMEGRGDMVSPLPPAPHRAVVLLFPAVHVPENKTAQMYSHLKAAGFTDGSMTQSLADDFRQGSNAFGGRLYNAFDSAGWEVFSGLRKYRSAFRVAGARDIHLAGAGPTLYTIVRERARADMVCQRLHAGGLDARVAEF